MVQENVKNPLAAVLERIDREWDGVTKRGAITSNDGECVFFYNEQGRHFRERVDDVLTVYRAPEGRIIGLQVKTTMLPPHNAIGVRVLSGDGEQCQHLVTLLLKTFVKRVRDSSAKTTPSADVASKYLEAISAVEDTVCA